MNTTNIKFHHDEPVFDRYGQKTDETRSVYQMAGIKAKYCYTKPKAFLYDQGRKDGWLRVSFADIIELP